MQQADLVARHAGRIDRQQVRLLEVPALGEPHARDQIVDRTRHAAREPEAPRHHDDEETDEYENDELLNEDDALENLVERRQVEVHPARIPRFDMRHEVPLAAEVADEISAAVAAFLLVQSDVGKRGMNGVDDIRAGTDEQFALGRGVLAHDPLNVDADDEHAEPFEAEVGTLVRPHFPCRDQRAVVLVRIQQHLLALRQVGPAQQIRDLRVVQRLDVARGILVPERVVQLDR